MTGRSRPTWLTETCPPWCVRAHHEDDHPEDRYHQSEPSIFVGVAGDGDEVPVTATLRHQTLGVRLGCHVGESSTWLAVESLESAQPRLILTAATARALQRRLDQQLGRL